MKTLKDFILEACDNSKKCPKCGKEEYECDKKENKKCPKCGKDEEECECDK